MLLGKTVGQLLDEITAEELQEWRAFNRIDPLPDPWVMHGVLCTLVHNGSFKKQRKPEDFIPRVRERREQSAAEQMAIIGLIGGA